jgi:uncharacterized protein (DUF1800 family)
MMDSLATTRFARQLGFGLAPSEPNPQDPVRWAQDQMDQAPDVQFFADRQGNLMQGLPEGLRLLSTQEEVAQALFRHEQARVLSNEKTKTLSAPEAEQFRYQNVNYPFWRLEPWKEVLARGAMAINGPAPVFERFWHFWTNHFTVSPAVNDINTAVGPYMRMLRGHMSGYFRDMLQEAVTHPAMVLYLDNAKSTGPHSRARTQGRAKESFNENLGREMLELFTVSPAGGYTQQDVIAAAMILTGWGVKRPQITRTVTGPFGSFFDDNKHEPNAQTVMGKEYGTSYKNRDKLLKLMDDLARHPATARHISQKLATAFITDEPSNELINRLTSVFQQSDGHLPTVHKAVIQEVAQAGASSHKLSNPETWLWTIYRVTGTALPVVPPMKELKGERVHELLTELGQAIHDCPQPNGWSLYNRDWLSKEMLDRRVRYAYQLAPRLVSRGDQLDELVNRQHGTNSQVYKLLKQARRMPDQSLRSLWAVYLTSPELLWS